MTLLEKMKTPGGFTTGFDYLRIILSVAVLVIHAINLTSGKDVVFASSWDTIPMMVLPMFFALSGFLVTGSLLRVRLHQFITLRLLRLIPALATEITLSALLLGPFVTNLHAAEYFQSKGFFQYFLNIIGYIHFYLPGAFSSNPEPGVMNRQLWTIPFEFECYATLVVLAILGILKRRSIFAAVVVFICCAYAIRVVLAGAVSIGHVPGRLLVFSFLAAVAIYLHRDVLPFSNKLGCATLLLSGVLLYCSRLEYLAAIPIAYATVWLGLMRPPAIPFGDLAYGVYLFHYPIQQTIIYLSLPHSSSIVLILLSFPLTALCGWLSWTFVESPLLSHKAKALDISDKIFSRIQRAFGITKATLQGVQTRR